jgi:hypothetical protein
LSRVVRALAALVLVMGGALQASAGVIFVGSWEVDDGPFWETNPATYTGQEAAAFLFGGSPTDYVISTIDATVANIDNMAWHSIWGVPDGTKFAQDFKIDWGAPGYNDPTGINNSASSAFVQDNAIGADFTNYAFRVDRVNAVPEPSAFAIFAISSLGACLVRRRRTGS